MKTEIGNELGTPDIEKRRKGWRAAERRYRQKPENREKYLAKRKRYRERHRDELAIKQGKRNKRRRGTEDRWTHLCLEPPMPTLVSVTRQQNAEVRRMLKTSRKSAKKRGIDFSLNTWDVVIPKRCPVLGIKLERRREVHAGTPSMDRVDNSKGYVPGNVRVISMRANTLKGALSAVEAKRLVRYMEQNPGQTTIFA